MDKQPLSQEVLKTSDASPTALVHDWLTGMRGGEKCLKILCELLPRADVFTLLHRKGSVDPVIESHPVHASFLQALPGVSRYYRHLLPLLPLAAESFDLQGYPLIVSVSHCVAKGVIPGPSSRHVCYCLTPMRYIWDQARFYFEEDFGTKAPRGLTRLVSHYLRVWDVAASNRVDEFVAISRFVADRIRKYYRREAQVLYPPVEWSTYEALRSPERDFYLVVSANAPYKRLDMVLDAFRRLDRKLKIVGNAAGRRAGSSRHGDAGNVEWLGWRSDEEIRQLFSNCRALLFPGIEDFGLVPVEVQAAGRPVIAYGQGGVLESVRGIPLREVKEDGGKGWQEDYTGIFFDVPTGKGLADAIECFESVEDRFDPPVIREWARRFDRPVFEEKWKRLLGTGDAADRR